MSQGEKQPAVEADAAAVEAAAAGAAEAVLEEGKTALQEAAQPPEATKLA